jgi:hypothetical protein
MKKALDAAVTVLLYFAVVVGALVVLSGVFGGW